MNPVNCDEAREGIHRLLDVGQRTELPTELREHLASCRDCRELGRDLSRIAESLRSMPQPVFRDVALERVLRTARESTPTPSRDGWLAWGSAVAAGLLLAAVTFGLFERRVEPSAPTAEEIAQARMVLALTADTLRRSRAVAVDDVLGNEISPALRRMPIRWSATAEEGK